MFPLAPITKLRTGKKGVAEGDSNSFNPRTPEFVEGYTKTTTNYSNPTNYIIEYKLE
jgi:hypothetical protein